MNTRTIISSDIGGSLITLTEDEGSWAVEETELSNPDADPILNVFNDRTRAFFAYQARIADYLVSCY
jgi:hypothetical protein